jgi:diguanylate cyclase (GGDEF)-like protein
VTRPNERRTKVLLVVQSDSDADLFEAILDAAVSSAFNVVQVSTVAQATSFLAATTTVGTTVDCAVVDLGFPDAEAIEIIETLAARAPAVALVALTDRDDDELGVATIEAGASDYLSKSVLDGKLLVRCIRHAVLRKRFESSLADAREEKELAKEALVHQALHDPLTGLPNRLLFLDRLSRALDASSRPPSNVCVIYVDIDRFKVINDSLGYPVGDQLLRVVATRLTGLVRTGDTLARVGSDEFAVLCAGVSGEVEAVGVADEVCAAMTEPVAWEGGELVISVSVGIAVAAPESISPDSLLTDAEAAMRRAKSEGRARSAVFAETMRSRAIGRLDTEVLLRRSIMNGDLRLHYQPIVHLVDGQVLGHEALVRWDHPTRGLLGPDQFINVAEETGLIIPLGTWVLQEACRQAKRFQVRDPRWSQLTMSVNLSGRQLGQPDLIELIASALDDADLRPEHLQLEMTEGILMDDAAATIGILEMLKGLGVRLDVDDFGTGYSSLAYLKRFPVDVLKIDHSFVHDLGKDPEDAAIIAAVVGLADALGFSVIAEGVETALQRDCLFGLGCTSAQGYLFAHPVDASAAEMALDHAMGRLPGGHGEHHDERAVPAGRRP